MSMLVVLVVAMGRMVSDLSWLCDVINGFGVGSITLLCYSGNRCFRG